MIEFKLESYEEIIEELVALSEDHWKEVEWGQDKIPLEPCLETYKLANETDSLYMYSVRNEDEELVGYATFWIYRHPHHKNTVFAVNDLLYLLPEYRHTGYSQNLIYFCEQDLKGKGVGVITYSMKIKHRFEDLMYSSGYEHTESTFSKFVG
jgi:GNAT superfamily N-acetyltransferase